MDFSANVTNYKLYSSYHHHLSSNIIKLWLLLTNLNKTKSTNILGSDKWRHNTYLLASPFLMANLCPVYKYPCMHVNLLTWNNSPRPGRAITKMIKCDSGKNCDALNSLDVSLSTCSFIWSGLKLRFCCKDSWFVQNRRKQIKIGGGALYLFFVLLM